MVLAAQLNWPLWSVFAMTRHFPPLPFADNSGLCDRDVISRMQESEVEVLSLWLRDGDEQSFLENVAYEAQEFEL